MRKVQEKMDKKYKQMEKYKVETRLTSFMHLVIPLNQLENPQSKFQRQYLQIRLHSMKDKIKIKIRK